MQTNTLLGNITTILLRRKNVDVRDGQFNVRARGNIAVHGLNGLLVEREKTRRLLLLATVVLTVLSAVLAVFAPEGKETITYVIAGVLFILALGSIGASIFSFKLPGIEVSTQQDNQSTREPHQNDDYKGAE